MIFAGVKLMFVGMTTVMLFLFFMIFFINLVSFFTREAATREMETIKKDKEALALSRKITQTATGEDDDEDIAVIAAAVTAYESERFAAI